MTPKSQRIAIAEYCGWTKFNPRAWRPDLFCWAPPSNSSPVYKHAGRQHGWGKIVTKQSEFFENDLPNYPTDLNAMHDAEMVLTPHDAMRYACVLAKAANPIFAPAAKRAEAFLRTLAIWDESK